MSKTVEIQIEKSRNLIKGLRKHIAEKGEKGITGNEIHSMEDTIMQLEAVNGEVDKIREELTEKVQNLNELFKNVKDVFMEKKKTMKGYYPQELWTVYGIPDKR